MRPVLIGILGGSFDPIHKGHLHLAQEVFSALHLKEVRFIPCAQNPLKPNPPAIPTDIRLKLLKIALAPFKHFHIDEREIHQTGLTYTIDTLKSLRCELGSTPMAFIMASDTAANLPKWKDWDQITQYTHLIIAKRPGYSMPTITLPGKLTRDPEKLYSHPSGYVLFQKIKERAPISATDIRLHNQAREKDLPAEVRQYIKEHQLY